MFSPAFVLSFVVSTAYGAFFHLWQGGPVRDLVLYLVAAWLGFAIGEWAADALGLHWFLIGQVHIVEGSLASWVVLFAARWLKLPE